MRTGSRHDHRFLTPWIACLVVSAAVAEQENWPCFRGGQASGVSECTNVPVTWDAEKGENIKWKTRINGLAHSSPIVWGERVYLTSAVSENEDPYLRIGMYGESPDHPEEIVHDFNLYCLDKRTGDVVWTRTAYSGIPKVKRHIKSSHANATPSTDGKHIVAFFGSEGLYCYDMGGKLIWKKDLGRLNSCSWGSAEIQWGFASSPTIHGDMVIVQCDVFDQSFIAAFNIDTGQELWRTLREEAPTWGTPTIVEHGDRTQVVANGWKHIGGYDVADGSEIWRMKGGGDIPVPTPVMGHGLIFITNAHGPMMPIYAIRLDAEGDITLAEGETSNAGVAWMLSRRGAYMPTPIVVGDHLYICGDLGILACYEARTGKKIYRKRLGKARRDTFTASPVAADGKLYFTSEQGDVYVVRAGAEYELLATNNMDGDCLATPAVSDGLLLVRTSKHLYGIAHDSGSASK